MTHTVEEIVMEARQLPPEEQKQLLAILMDLLTSSVPESPASSPPPGPYAFSLALAGSAHSDFTDASADKYRHLAEAYRDQ